ncbi:MAG: dihydropteroate synthase [Gammaproteobacteria bacterium]
MVILGLGSNLGDRLGYLRHALALLKTIPNFSIEQVSPIYISDALLPENAPADWNTPYLNLALRCETTLTPYELLNHTKNIENKVGRKPEKNWGPRVIDIDLLAWDDLIQYDEKLHIPHENLHERPFALWPLADVAPHWIYPLEGSAQGKTAVEMISIWGSRFDGLAPFHTRQIQQRIDTPQLVGILNVTPDSFSDGGKFTTIENAIDHVKQLVASGAQIIDIGAEATGPNVQSLDADSEWQRLEPVLTALIPVIPKLFIPPKISIDTRHASVAKKALAMNVDWINDVSSFADPDMKEIIAAQHCDVVIMHHLGIPVSAGNLIPQNQNAVSFVSAWGEKKLNDLEKSGISRERIIFDVGIGYGNTPEQALELIKLIDEFKKLNTRLLVGHSRKSFLKQFTTIPPSERDLETTVISLYLANQQVDYLRVHNVDMHARALKVRGALLHFLREVATI